MLAWFEAAALQAEAVGGTGAAFGAIEKGAKDWPGTLVLRLEAALPCPVSSGGEWLPVSPRMETSMDRGPVEAVLHHRVEGCRSCKLCSSVRDQRASGRGYCHSP